MCNVDQSVSLNEFVQGTYHGLIQLIMRYEIWLAFAAWFSYVIAVCPFLLYASPDSDNLEENPQGDFEIEFHI